MASPLPLTISNAFWLNTLMHPNRDEQTGFFLPDCFPPPPPSPLPSPPCLAQVFRATDKGRLSPHPQPPDGSFTRKLRPTHRPLSGDRSRHTTSAACSNVACESGQCRTKARPDER